MADRLFYSCAKCPAYCCTYAHIPVTRRDIERLARGHGITFEKAEAKFTKRGDADSPRVLRHRSDQIFETACHFLDAETRNCTIYEMRPAACREYPGTPRCGYYDFLAAERGRHEDPDLVITAWITDLE
ncbi:MAG: YkgJ family cysteine cluster protein [Longimicrobiales bacterium]|nr:YkgJ family cysteine cluster protein [Longimicrobiales bacterium]